MIALDANLRDLLNTIRIDQVGVMDHLWLSITKLRSFIDLLHTKIDGLEQEVGDTAKVLDEHNLVDLSEGVIWALSQISPASFVQANFDDLQAKVSKLSDLIFVVDEDHQQVSKFLMTKIPTLPRHSGPRRGPSGQGIGAALTMGMNIVDDSGAVVGTLGQLMEGFKSLTSKNAQLQEQVESLSGNMAAQGGHVLDGLAFLLEAQAMEAVLMEAPNGDAFVVFLDVMSLFCCD